MKKEKKKQGRGIKFYVISLLFLIVLLIVAALFLVENIVAVFSAANQEITKTATLEHGWNLILVNSEYHIPDDFKVPELTVLSNGQKVDTRIYPELQKMFDDARAEGLDLFVASGYRTKERQQELMDERIQKYRAMGETKEKAEELALWWVAVPGSSEHELGIAVDINANTEVSTSEEVYTWLEEHAYQYGFIKRYPSDKVHITGIAHEPWHYRYVGIQTAKEIYDTGVCLEEYIKEKYGK